MTQLESLQQIDRTQNIEGAAVRLYFLSRSPRVLGGMAAVILAIGLGLAFILRSQEPAGTKHPRSDALQTELAKEAPDIEKIIMLLSRGAARDVFAEEGATWIVASKLPTSDKTVAVALWESLTDWPVEPGADLLFCAHTVQPLRHANELVGDLYLGAKRKDEAITYFEREAKHPEATGARQKLFELLLEKRDFAAARRIADDSTIGPRLTPANRVMLAVGERRWTQVLEPLLAMEREYLKPMPTMLAGLAGLVWLIIALQAIQPPRLISFRTFVPLLAVAAGVISIVPTLFSVLFEEEMWKLKATGDFLNDLVFYIVGVGPREELCKLLCFLPFVPILLLRRSRLEMLMVAGCVGLGFAIEENVQYFANAGPAIAFGRFLTANFLHLAATGIIGLAFCDWVVSPLKKFLPFIGKTVAVIFAHGCYDAFIGVEELLALALVSMMSYMLLALFFFRTLRTLRDPATDQVSIAGTLVVGISVLNAAVLVCASMTLGFLPALAALAFTAFGLIMITYMFYWQLGEGMSHAIAAEETAAGRFATAV
jgi:RsiW-degrading membrane proteinase PrsW (M82 family)